jgi:hypothetical protein
MAGAGLWTTPTDLAQLAIALQQAYAGTVEAFLSQALVHQALTPQVNPEYGLGTRLWGPGPAHRFGHSGDTIGYNSASSAFVEGGAGVVVMSNSDEGSLVIDELTRAIAREYRWPDDGTPRRAMSSPPDLGSYVGTYELHAGFSIAIVRRADALWLQATGQPPLALQPSTEGCFFSPNVNSIIEFTRDDANAVAGLTILQEGQELHATKV